MEFIINDQTWKRINAKAQFNGARFIVSDKIIGKYESKAMAMGGFVNDKGEMDPLKIGEIAETIPEGMMSSEMFIDILAVMLEPSKETNNGPKKFTREVFRNRKKALEEDFILDIDNREEYEDIVRDFMGVSQKLRTIVSDGSTEKTKPDLEPTE